MHCGRLAILGHINIDDDDVPRDKEVAAKENEAIFDSLSPCGAYSCPNLSNDFMARQRRLRTLQVFVNLWSNSFKGRAKT